MVIHCKVIFLFFFTIRIIPILIQVWDHGWLVIVSQLTIDRIQKLQLLLFLSFYIYTSSRRKAQKLHNFKAIKR